MCPTRPSTSSIAPNIDRLDDHREPGSKTGRWLTWKASHAVSLMIPVHIKEIEFLRHLPNLKQLGYSDPLPMDEFWKAYDARTK